MVVEPIVKPRLAAFQMATSMKRAIFVSTCRDRGRSVPPDRTCTCGCGTSSVISASNGLEARWLSSSICGGGICRVIEWGVGAVLVEGHVYLSGLREAFAKGFNYSLAVLLYPRFAVCGGLSSWRGVISGMYARASALHNHRQIQ